MIELRLIGNKAARYAVEHWHYSRTMPAAPLIRYGVFEDGDFIGCVLFGRGASAKLPKSFGLKSSELCELVRVALKGHNAPVSQIVAQALAQLRTSNPGLRLVVSFADPAHGHVGGIYQAGNWLYLGTSAPKLDYRQKRTGKILHSRLVSKTGFVKQYGRMVKVPTYDECTPIRVPGKHRYVMPLDKQTRRRMIKLVKDYPHAAEGSEATR